MLPLSAVLEAYLIASSDGLSTADLHALLTARLRQLQEELEPPTLSATCLLYTSDAADD